MARCGVRVRYAVRVVGVRDDGSRSAPLEIGEAETLPLALALAERLGFCVREAEDGGHSRFLAETSPPHFLVTVYPA